MFVVARPRCADHVLEVLPMRSRVQIESSGMTRRTCNGPSLHVDAQSFRRSDNCQERERMARVKTGRGRAAPTNEGSLDARRGSRRLDPAERRTSAMLVRTPKAMIAGSQPLQVRCTREPEQMIKTVEAIVDEKGNVKLLEQVRLGVPRRALVTILDEKPAARVSETALLSEATLGEDWNRTEEDEAWAHLQGVPQFSSSFPSPTCRGASCVLPSYLPTSAAAIMCCARSRANRAPTRRW